MSAVPNDLPMLVSVDDDYNMGENTEIYPKKRKHYREELAVITSSDGESQDSTEERTEDIKSRKRSLKETMVISRLADMDIDKDEYRKSTSKRPSPYLMGVLNAARKNRPNGNQEPLPTSSSHFKPSQFLQDTLNELLVPQKPSYEKPTNPDSYGVVPNKIPYYVAQNSSPTNNTNNPMSIPNNTIANNNTINKDATPIPNIIKAANNNTNNAVMENPQKYLNAGDQRLQPQHQQNNKKYTVAMAAAPTKEKFSDIYDKGDNGSSKDKEDLPEWMTFTKWGRRPKRRRMDLLEFL